MASAPDDVERRASLRDVIKRGTCIVTHIGRTVEGRSYLRPLSFFDVRAAWNARSYATPTSCDLAESVKTAIVTRRQISTSGVLPYPVL